MAHFKKVSAFAPATIANLNCGFDVLGLALSSIGDTVEVGFTADTEIVITEIVNGDNLPKEAHKNSCSVVVQKMREALGESRGVEMRIKKGFLSGSGLGSSSASSAAAAMAFNLLCGSPYSTKELVQFAVEGERVACGSAHADNVAPALLGGVTLVRSNDPLEVIELPVPEEMYAVLFFPQITINTYDARGILKENMPVKEAIKQWANLGAFVAALYQKDFDLLSRSMQDLVAEPYRSQLIPRFKEMKKAALEAGAFTFGISGSGPSVFALCKNEDQAKAVQQNLLEVYQDGTLKSLNYMEKIDPGTGAKEVPQF